MPMSEWQEATERLERAIARLEAASKRLADRAEARRPEPTGEAEATALVAARLEEAIQRIDQLLEE
jgi:exonuclease VII small subunit